MNVYVCPVCGAPLLREGNALRCEHRHSYDISAAGYVNLTPPLAGRHGDDADMVAARRAFLNKGHYDPLRRAVCDMLSAASPKTLLDAGCGEGYYTGSVCETIPDADVYGVDVSKKAVEKASKYCRQASFCVASVYRMPYADRSFDAILNVFSPLALDEYLRTLRPGGSLVMAVPAPDHLIELKRAVYKDVFIKEMKDDALDGFSKQEVKRIAFTMDLDGETLRELFGMTPYAKKTSLADRAKLDCVDRMSVTASFFVYRYTKL